MGERIADTVAPALDSPAAVEFGERPQRTRGAGYYVPAAIELSTYDDGAEVELGDGGFVDWTAQLLGNAKERCLISCLSTERVAALMRS